MDQRSVLVVEDDETVRTLIAEVLADAGYAVLEADCGRQALLLAYEHVPSIVVMDHLLPDMSGLDVLEQLRARPSSRYIPVMLVSGLAQKLVGRDHGADDVLTKPFDITALVDRVGALASDVRAGTA